MSYVQNNGAYWLYKKQVKLKVQSPVTNPDYQIDYEHFYSVFLQGIISFAKDQGGKKIQKLNAKMAMKVLGNNGTKRQDYRRTTVSFEKEDQYGYHIQCNQEFKVPFPQLGKTRGYIYPGKLNLPARRKDNPYNSQWAEMAEVSDRYILLEDFKFISVFYEPKLNLNIAQDEKILMARERKRQADIEHHKKLYYEQRESCQNLASTLYEFNRLNKPSADIYMRKVKQQNFKMTSGGNIIDMGMLDPSLIDSEAQLLQYGDAIDHKFQNSPYRKSPKLTRDM